MLRVLYIFSK